MSGAGPRAPPGSGSRPPGAISDGHSSPTYTAIAADLGPGLATCGQERVWSRTAGYPKTARYPNHSSPAREAMGKPWAVLDGPICSSRRLLP